MNLTRCRNGHFYDKERNSSCPHCTGEERDIGRTLELFHDPLGDLISGKSSSGSTILENTPPLKKSSGSMWTPAPIVGRRVLEKDADALALTAKQVTIFPGEAKIISQAVFTMKEDEEDVYITGIPMQADLGTVHIQMGNGFQYDMVSFCRHEVIEDEEKKKALEEIEQEMEEAAAEFAYWDKERKTLRKCIRHVVKNDYASGNIEDNLDALKKRYDQASERVIEAKKRFSQNGRRSSNIEIKTSKYYALKIHVRGKAGASCELLAEYMIQGMRWGMAYDILSYSGNDKLTVLTKARVYSQLDIPWKQVRLVLSTGTNGVLQSLKEESFRLRVKKSIPVPDFPLPMSAEMMGAPMPSARMDLESFPRPSMAPPMPPGMPEDPDATQWIMPEQEVSLSNGFGADGSVAGRQKAWDDQTMVVSVDSANDRAAMQSADSISRYYVVKGLVDLEEFEECEIVIEKKEFTYQKHFIAVPRNDYAEYLWIPVDVLQDVNFYQGTICLYYDGTVTGRFDSADLEEGQKLVLGRSEAVEARRKECLNEVNSLGLLSGKRVIRRKYEITVTNHEDFPVSLEVHDCVPVTEAEEIDIRYSELSGGEIDAETGLCVWNLALQAKEEVKLVLAYSVAYSGKIEVEKV